LPTEPLLVIGVASVQAQKSADGQLGKRLTQKQTYSIWNAAKKYAEASKRCNGCSPADKAYQSFLFSREKLSYQLSLALPEIALCADSRYKIIESLKTNCMIHPCEHGAS